MNRKYFAISIFLSCFLVLSCCVVSQAAQTGSVIGRWSDTAYKNNRIYIFYKDKDDVIMYSATNSQDVRKFDTLKKQNDKYFSQLHQDMKEYYVVNGKGELEIHDKGGLIRKCQPYSGPEFPLPSLQPAKIAGTRKIEFVPTVVGDFQVQVDISADLPDGSLLSVNLSKHGLASNDRFIGTDFDEVPVNGGKASILIDAQNKPQPSLATIIKGKYDVEVKFFPRWPQNRGFAASAKISEPIEVVKVVSLNGTSKSSEDYSKQKVKAKNRKWVIENVRQGMKWDEKDWESRFGKPEIHNPASGNTNVLKMFYFKAIDITVQVKEPLIKRHF